ncbi:phage terminase large subunit [Spiroplasma citri]|uniref:phage terminase large subunit n=1 Tax=Spiroplasma citri TaxID=2133 RepID=UPI00247A64B4|nr:phage terminase large subunit [Spiroplasma citri]
MEYLKIFKILLEKHNIPFSVNLSTHSFTIPNGTKIICNGLHSQTKREKLKAFADLNKYEFAIEWREEADQLTKDDMSEIKYAIRGAKRKFIINSSNPESLKRYIVGYCNQLYLLMKQLMRSKWEQTAYIEKWDMKIIIHYTNWRLNSFLPTEEENKILRSEKLDPVRARVWSWGLPGKYKVLFLLDILYYASNRYYSTNENIRWCWFCPSR